MAPVLTFRAPYKTRLFRLPIMGASTGLPLRAHLARKGGVSVMMVASVKSTTVRFLPFSPRLSPLLLAARKDPDGPAHTWAVSTGSPSLADSGVPCSRLPQYSWWLAGGSGAGQRSSLRPGSHSHWDGCPSPVAPYPPGPGAGSGGGRAGPVPQPLGDGSGTLPLQPPGPGI